MNVLSVADTSDPGPVIIVSGFLRCGMATTMAMLEAGGLPIAGGAQPPTYELPQTAHKAEGFVRGVFGPYGIADRVLAQLPASMLEMGDHYDPAWIAGCRGQAVKIVNPHLIPSMPKGDHRVIWCDRDEQSRARSLLRYMGAPVTGLMADLVAAYFTACRSPARKVLGDAGARLLDVEHADLAGSPEKRKATVDRIADFVGAPLDRDAMVKRLETVVAFGA